MAKDVITTALLVIATVVAVSIFVMSMMPSIRELSITYSSITKKLNDKIKTDIKILFIETNDTYVKFWVKNVGLNEIDLQMINLSDVFIISRNSSYHFTLSDSDVDYSIVNGDGDSYWENGETLEVLVNVSLNTSEEYLLTFVLYNGVEASDVFSR